jgi:arylsulfatase A-like enzyme
VTRFDSAAGFQGYKRSLHEGGIRIPFIAWMPGTVAPGISDHLGYFPDLLPTFCELAGTVAPTAHDGLSLAPLLAGRGTQARHGHLFFEFENQIAVRSGNWKYYRGRRGPEPCAPDVPNDDEALYDLAADRHEDRDLKAEHPEVLRELKTHVVHEHREYTPDPVPPAYEPRRSLNRSEGINQ